MRMGSALRLALSVALAVLALSAILFRLDSPRATAQPLAGTTRGYPSALCNTTLQACIDLSVDGDRITITPGTYITSVTLNKAVSLVGAGANTTIIQALPTQRVLTVTGSTITPSTTINGLTLMGGNLSGVVCPDACGGAVWVTAGALPNFIDVTLRNNSAYKGGGLYADSAGKLFVQYANILSNTVTGDGGGINTTSSITLVVNGGRIQNNRSTSAFGFGGGILSDGPLFLEFVGIISNAVTGPGGGAYASNNVETYSTTFQLNTSGDQGGGLRVNANLHAQFTDFVGNTAKQGGGAHISGGVIIISGTMRNNSASGDKGGGLYARSTALMLGAQFISNSAPLLGGGALVSGSLTANDSLFQANSVKLAGAGLYVSGTATLNNTNFLTNSENGFAPGDRGAGGAYVVGDVTVRGGRFQSNSCFSFCLAGGLWTLGQLIQISGTQFISNSASSAGGLYVDTLAGTLRLTQTQFISNSADGNGGGLESHATTFMSGVTLQGNHADNHGGGGLFRDRVTLNGTQVSGRVAGYAAAGIEGGQILISGARFENNNASSFAGALLDRYSLDIHESLFISNSAPSGGAIFHDGPGNATITNSLFARNQAGDAALVLAQNATYRLLHDTFADTTLNPHAAIQLLTGTLYLSDTIVVSHSLVFSQADGIIYEDYNLFFGNPLVRGGSGGWLVFGGHDVHSDPQFVGPPADNYHLRLTSPAIDAGICAGVTTDIDGQPRPLGASFDIGFDEVNVRKVLLPLVKR